MNKALIDRVKHLTKEQMSAVRVDAVQKLATPPDNIRCELCGNTGYVMSCPSWARGLKLIRRTGLNLNLLHVVPFVGTWIETVITLKIIR